MTRPTGATGIYTAVLERFAAQDALPPAAPGTTFNGRSPELAADSMPLHTATPEIARVFAGRPSTNPFIACCTPAAP
jgi:hypothetical protein